HFNMKVFKTNFAGNPNIGLYAYCNNQYCLVSRIVPNAQIQKIENVLGVKTIRMSVAGTSLLGAFLAGNDNCLLVPDIVFDDEIRILEDNDIHYKIIHTKLTALGNNICCNNHGVIINEEFEKAAAEDIKSALNVPVIPGKIAGLDITGSLCVANDKNAITHNKISKKEREKAESLLKARILAVTVDNNPYVKGGIVLNNNGYLISDIAKTIEITLIDQTLNE
ncbi:translation initiation factor IF-6, partial [Candidatus Woesearchaeota archaeon]|nr:translation initiation factor IF-6 [Candidatus Woesearchaeota archaeon]